MDQSREILLGAFLEVVDNQINDDNPPETRETFERLQRAGHSEDEAKRLIAGLVAAETFEMIKEKKLFNEARFIERLHQLPEMPWMEEA